MTVLFIYYFLIFYNNPCLFTIFAQYEVCIWENNLYSSLFGYDFIRVYKIILSNMYHLLTLDS